VDCRHIFAERLRRGLVVVTDVPSAKVRAQKTARRAPARKRKAHDGRAIRTAQRAARRKMDKRLPGLLASLMRQFRNDPDVPADVIPLKRERGGQLTPIATRAAALILKVAKGLSSDAMVETYEKAITNGTLRLNAPPHPNTLSEWFNDPALTEVLRRFLTYTAQPFRRREIAGIIDSTKISQMMSLSARRVDYGDDTDGGADWMKAHCIVDRFSREGQPSGGIWVPLANLSWGWSVKALHSVQTGPGWLKGQGGWYYLVYASPQPTSATSPSNVILPTWSRNAIPPGQRGNTLNACNEDAYCHRMVRSSVFDRSGRRAWVL
jgi:hypothetical protein